MINNKKHRLIALALGIIILAIVTILLWNRNTIYTDNAYIKSDIVIIRAKVTGYISEILIKDNETVKSGQLLARIENKDYKLKLKRAQEKVNSAKAIVTTFKYRIKIEDLELHNKSLKKDTAKASFENAKTQLNRAKNLIKHGSTSQQDLDKKTESYILYKNAYEIALSDFESTKNQQEITILKKNEAESFLKLNEAELELAQIDLDNTRIRAPQDGIISKRSLQIGQLVSPPIALAYLVSNNPWVLANFKEIQTSKMIPGQKAIITIDSIPGKKLTAKLDSISPATGSEFSILPSENATGNFTKIIQRIPVKLIFDNNQDLSTLKSGLSCEVRVKF